MTTIVAVFTRDLRVRDNPMLAGAVRGAEQVVPLFVRDDRVTAASTNRTRFLDAALSDVDTSLRERGGRLVVRNGDPVAEICRVAAEVSAVRVHIAGDVSVYAQTRVEALRAALTCELVVHDDVHTVVPPGALTPSGKDHFAVFSAYHRQWVAHEWRQQVPAPRRIVLPKICVGSVRSASGGGETAARQRMTSWRGGRRRRRSSSGSSRGGTSTTRCWPPGRTRPARTTGHAATVGSMTSMRSTHGARARRASRSSTPACGSCSVRAGCTTARG